MPIMTLIPMVIRMILSSLVQRLRSCKAVVTVMMILQRFIQVPWISAMQPMMIAMEQSMKM